MKNPIVSVSTVGVTAVTQEGSNRWTSVHCSSVSLLPRRPSPPMWGIWNWRRLIVHGALLGVNLNIWNGRRLIVYGALLGVNLNILNRRRLIVHDVLLGVNLNIWNGTRLIVHGSLLGVNLNIWNQRRLIVYGALLGVNLNLCCWHNPVDTTWNRTSVTRQKENKSQIITISMSTLLIFRNNHYLTRNIISGHRLQHA